MDVSSGELLLGGGGAGDVNGDGFADVLLRFENSATIVYGRSSFPAGFDPSPLDAADGFRVTGKPFISSFGSGPAFPYGSGAGDVNHDGFSDLVIGGNVIFGSSGNIAITKNGRTATFTDVGGDVVTIRVSKGRLSADDFILSNPDLGGAQLQRIDFAGQTSLNGADVTITAHRGPSGGDGFVNIGHLRAP